MEAKAQARYVRVTPLMARRVVDTIRGQRATEAVTVPRFAPQAVAETVRKLVESAIANARVKAEMTRAFSSSPRPAWTRDPRSAASARADRHGRTRSGPAPTTTRC